MIDIENKIYTEVITELLTEYPNIKTESEYVETTSEVPCVTFYEIDNTIYQKSQTLDCIENDASVTYESNIFTSGSLKKSEAKNIAQIIDDKMGKLGFTRTFYQRVPNYDRSVYRLILRWKAVVSKGHTVGTTTTHIIHWR